MGLRRRLAAAAVSRTSVLLAEVPGWARTRVGVEQAVRRRGWRVALSPGDADVLLTCGLPGPRLQDALDLVWAQMPGPRARIDVASPTAVEGLLDQAASALLDGDHQSRDAAARPIGPTMGTPATAAETGNGGSAEPEDADDGPPSDGSEEHAGHARTDHEGHGDMDHEGHGGMDHGGMEMEMPGGIPLAEGGGEDRDGLDLDVLHLPLGPVLPFWPAGLVLHCTLAGDVVTEARPELLRPADGASGGEPLPPAVDRLDRAVGVLALAGWDAAALGLAGLRDDPRLHTETGSCGPLLERWRRRVRRSLLLRWSLRGVGRLSEEDCRRHGVDPRLAGDAHDRLLALLDEARAALDSGATEPARTPVDVLGDLVAGHELGAVRLLVAGLDLDTGARVPAGAGAAG